MFDVNDDVYVHISFPTIETGLVTKLYPFTFKPPLDLLGETELNTCYLRHVNPGTELYMPGKILCKNRNRKLIEYCVHIPRLSAEQSLDGKSKCLFEVSSHTIQNIKLKNCKKRSHQYPDGMLCDDCWPNKEEKCQILRMGYICTICVAVPI